MTYRTILAIIQNEDEAAGLIDNAIGLARKFDAHLIGFHSEPVQVAYAAAAGFPDAEFIRTTTEMGIERSKRIAGLFGGKTREAGISAEWGTPEGEAPSDMSLAHSVDLILAAQPRQDGPDDDLADVDNLLYEAGRPVLVLPRAKPCPAEFRRIVVGWNGTKQAARAVFDALPLLTAAESVELLVVGRSSTDRDVGAVVSATLKRHGVPVELARETSDGLSVEEALANRVAAIDADLLVLGAYGHSWLREFLFGGVTRQLLKNCPVATLLSH